MNVKKRLCARFIHQAREMFESRPLQALEDLHKVARWLIEDGDSESGALCLAAAEKLFEYHAHDPHNSRRYHHPQKLSNFFELTSTALGRIYRDSNVRDSAQV